MLFVFFFQHNPLNSLCIAWTFIPSFIGSYNDWVGPRNFEGIKHQKIQGIQSHFYWNIFVRQRILLTICLHFFVLNRTRTISSVMIIGSWNKSYLLLKVIYKKNIAINIAAFRQASQTAKDGPPRKKTYTGKLKKLASFRKRDLVLTS